MTKISKKAILTAAGILLLLLMAAGAVYAIPGVYQCRYCKKVVDTMVEPSKAGCTVDIEKYLHSWKRMGPPGSGPGQRIR